MKMTIATAIALTLLWLPYAIAVEPRTQHTFALGEGESAPAATLKDVTWLAGTWHGTAFGSTFEEVWSPPSADSMVGTFKLIGEDGMVKFYELLILTVDSGRLTLKVKHFNADFSAWEEKAEYVSFKVVSVAENAIHFAGISFYQRDNDQMDGYIVMRTSEGVTEEKLSYRRVP